MASFRHARLYIKALECVQLGDSNMNCYEVCLVMLGEVSAKLLRLSLERDGMGLADREAAEAAVVTAENIVDDDVGDCVSDST
jgi:hypothetical protein